MILLAITIQGRNFSISCHHLPQKRGDYLGESFWRYQVSLFSYNKKFSRFLTVFFFLMEEGSQKVCKTRYRMQCPNPRFYFHFGISIDYKLIEMYITLGNVATCSFASFSD